jgi:hypothetical protein
MANFETTQNDSGAGTGNEKEGWQTTRGMKGLTYVRMFGAPVILIAGNRQDDAFPPSTLGGGRIQSLCSSVMDTTGRLFVPNCVVNAVASQGTPQASRSRADDMYAAYVAGRHPKRLKSAKLWDTLENSETRDTVAMREITDTLVEQNVRYFFMRHLWRKAIPFIHRTMTLGVVVGEYNLFSGFNNMVISVRGLTEGFRRNYMVDDTSFKRNITGPWQTVSAFSTFGMQLSDWCVSRAFRAAGDSIDLYKAFQDIIFGFLHVPITFSAKLSSLHSWLFTNVLDVSSMTLLSYFMYITGFRSFCPLNVLALAARGLHMNDEQEKEYEAFCESIVHLVTPSVAGLTDKGPLSGVKNLRQGLMKEVKKECLERWFNWRSDEEGLMAAREARNQDKQVSVFVAPTLQFVSRGRADWMKRKGDEIDEYTAGNATRMIAHAYALEQTPKAHQTRVEYAQPLLQFHRPHEFWEAVHKGTRMPRPDPELGKMDRYELDFEPVWETGFWYEQVIRRLGCCRGVMKHFLVLCGMDDQTSLRELVIAILTPYLNKRLVDRSTVRFYNTEEWNAPILDCREMFAWGAQPHVLNRRIEGVEVILGMRLAYYIIAQGLVCRGWRRSSKGYEVLVNLRNMAFISLEMLLLFLHTRVEKAVIPVNNGYVVMPQRSPEGNGNVSRVVFDDRLHVDTVKSSEDMLCMRARKTSEWSEIAGERPYIIYKCMSGDAKGDCDDPPFPFPPESVMHMESHYTIMKRVHTCYLKEQDRKSGVDECGLRHSEYNSLVALGMRLYGCNVRSEMVSYIPATLTHCVVQSNREIPCVTFADGYTFCLRYEQETSRVVLFSVEPTHKWMYETEDMSGNLFIRLPLEEEVRFPPYLLGDIMCRGIKVCNEEIHVDLEMGGEELPFWFFPVVHWPCLVVIGMDSQVLKCTDAEGKIQDLNFLTVAEWTERHKGCMQSEKDLQEWFIQNSDVPTSSTMMSSGDTLKMMRKDDQNIFLMEVSGIGTLVLFEKFNLKYFLEQKSMRQYHDGEWVFCDRVVEVDDRVFPLVEKSDGSIVVEIYKYSNDAHALYARQIAEETKSLNSLDDNIQRLVAESRSVDSLMHVRAERIMHRQSLRDKMAKVRVQAELATTFKVGKTLDVCMMAGPPLRQDTLTLGMVQPHDNGQYLHNGCYNVTHLSVESDDEIVRRQTKLDFVTMSRCILREGSRVWLAIDEQAVHDLSEVGLTLLGSDETPVTLGGDRIFLSAFYVLGGTNIDEHVLDARIRVLLKVRGDHWHALRVRVFTSKGLRRVYLTVDSDATCLEFCVRNAEIGDPVDFT